MTTDKTKSAQILFDAIGEIDDRIIFETQTPFRVIAKRNQKKRLVILLASILTTVTLFVATALTVANLAFDFLLNATDENIPPSVDSPDLQQTLINASQSQNVTCTDEQDIDLFDGKAKLIWRVNGEDAYYVVPISSHNTLSQLNTQMRSKSTLLSPEKAETVECDVWISYGDGTVVTPYLKYSEGNIGYAELFEYSPEIEPNEELVSVIDDLISE